MLPMSLSAINLKRRSFEVLYLIKPSYEDKAHPWYQNDNGQNDKGKSL